MSATAFALSPTARGATPGLALTVRAPGQDALLPAGHLKHRPVDLLASGNMARLVEELRTLLPHHVIVFDSRRTSVRCLMKP